MKLRSSSSTREGTSIPKLSRKPAFKSTKNNSAMSKALQNPLILDNIFAQLKLSDLKAARIVCREWNDVGTSLLQNRSSLQVNKLYRYDGSKLYQVTPVNEKLTRSLSITDKFDPSVPNRRTDDVVSKVFSDLSSNISQVTKEIAFYVTLKKFMTAFLNGLRTLESTQIQHISIFVNARNANVKKGRIQALQELPGLKNLTSLKFQLHPMMQFWGIGVHTFQPLLQVLIDSAPKLTSLDVMASFCPNLEGCKNLTVLKFDFAKCNHRACPDFKLATVTTMLTSVKDSLTELELSYSDLGTRYSDDPEGQNLAVPVMANLTSLSIHAPHVYLIHDFFGEKHLPRLQKVSLQNHYLGRTKLTTHLNLWKGHRGVKSLALKTRGNYQTDDRFAEKMVELFPAVKKLSLTLTPCDANINQMLGPFQRWDLEEVKLVVGCECVATGVVRVLRNMANLRGDKSAHFERTGIRRNDFAASIQDVILYSGGFKRVEISGAVVPEIVDVMRPIFEASGAPVDFKGGVY